MVSVLIGVKLKLACLRARSLDLFCFQFILMMYRVQLVLVASYLLMTAFY